jgi:hypothetical protein
MMMRMTHTMVPWKISNVVEKAVCVHVFAFPFTSVVSIEKSEVVATRILS